MENQVRDYERMIAINLLAGGANESGSILSLKQVDDDRVVARFVDPPGLFGHLSIRPAVRFDRRSKRLALDPI